MPSSGLSSPDFSLGSSETPPPIPSPASAPASDGPHGRDLHRLGAWDLSGPIPFRIRGDDLQTVEFLLTPGQRIHCEPHAFVCSRGGITNIGVSWGNSLLDPLRRLWSGEAAIQHSITCHGREGTVVLGAPQIGRVVRLRVRPGRGIVCQRGAYMAHTGTIRMSVAITRRLSAGVFGGQGLVFQHLSGDGDVFLHGVGSVIDWTAAAGEAVRVSTNNALAWEDSIGYKVQFAGGPLTLLFSGQGFFLSQLEGPGRIVIQSVDRHAFARDVGRSTRRANARNTARGTVSAADQVAG